MYNGCLPDKIEKDIFFVNGKWSEAGVKHDGDKTRVDLLDAEWLEAVGQVLKFGAKKYAAHNWRGGIAYSRLIGAALRHLLAIMRGEDTDPESGLPHTAHLSCCVMFLHWMMIHRKDQDDRYKTEESLEAKGKLYRQLKQELNDAGA